MVEVDSLADFEETVHEVAGFPMIQMAQTVYEPGQTATFEVLAAHPQVQITDGQGKPMNATVQSMGGDRYQIACKLPQVGLYSVTVKADGREVQGILSAHASWQWTLEQARAAALKYHQKATSHIESWYGFHSSFLAAKFFPRNRWMRLCALVLIICSICCMMQTKWNPSILHHVSRIHRVPSVCWSTSTKPMVTKPT